MDDLTLPEEPEYDRRIAAEEGVLDPDNQHPGNVPPDEGDERVAEADR